MSLDEPPVVEDRRIDAPCPACGARRAAEAYRHRQIRVFFCSECEHSWMSGRDGSRPLTADDATVVQMTQVMGRLDALCRDAEQLRAKLRTLALEPPVYPERRESSFSLEPATAADHAVDRSQSR